MCEQDAHNLVLAALGVAAAPAAADEFKSGPVTYVTATSQHPGRRHGRRSPRSARASAMCPEAGHSSPANTGEADDADISTSRPSDLIDLDSLHRRRLGRGCVERGQRQPCSDDHGDLREAQQGRYLTYNETDDSVGAGVCPEVAPSPARPARSPAPASIRTRRLPTSSSSRRSSISFNGEDRQLQPALVRLLQGGRRASTTPIFGLCSDADLEHRYKDRVVFGPGRHAQGQVPERLARARRRLQPLPDGPHRFGAIRRQGRRQRA